MNEVLLSDEGEPVYLAHSVVACIVPFNALFIVPFDLAVNEILLIVLL